ncbi:restriction endonuclease subunit S [Vibrio splendidus]|uniref:restriction endonuclease subunit S n=1 Tax=Vibrio splendidus TaxID=29497 RepID=UPI0034A0D00C
MSWPVVSFGDVAQFINGDRGKNYPSKGSFVDEGIPFINAGNLSLVHTIYADALNYITEDKFNSLNSGKIEKGDILFCLRGSLGKFALVDSDMKGAIASSLVIIRVNEKIHIDYLKHYLGSFLCEREIQLYENGAAQPNLSATDLKTFQIPLPPLEEQKRIAAILDKADAIRQKRKQAIDLADEFLRSVFLDMFGDPVTNPKKWDVKTISDFCNVSSGSTPSRKREDYFQGSIPWVKTTEVDGYVIKDTEEKITELAVRDTSCKLNPRGAIVVAMYGQGKTRGKVGILGVEAATNQACAVLAPSNSINMSYLYYYLKLSYETLRSLGQGGGQPNLNGTIVKQFPILHPPKHLQDRFVDIVTVYESTALKNNTVTGCCIELFNSLSQSAFSGQL